MNQNENSLGLLQNSIKIQIVISRANVALRDLFLARWKQFSSSPWNELSSKAFTAGIGRKLFVNSQKLQKASLLSGDVNKWDTTLLTDVLLQTEFSDQNLRPIKKERAILDELKKLRNFIAHQPDPALGIDAETFESMWQRFTKVLTFFNIPIKELEKIKSSNNLSIFQDENNILEANHQGEYERLKVAGNELYRAGQYAEAVDTFTKAISLSGLKDSDQAILHSNRSAGHLSIARTLDNNGKLAESVHCALQDGKDAIRLNPTWYKGYFRTGNAYMELKEYKNALGYFGSALSLSPGQLDLLNARDNCRLLIAQESRQELMDPTHMPFTDEELFKKMKTRFGDIKLNEWELANKLTTQLIPGLSFVREAQANMSGLGRPKNTELGARLFAKAASLGNAEGMYNLGHCYKYGNGVKQDFQMALKLFHQAASQPEKILGGSARNIGVAEAEHSLGLTYQEGIGVTQDFTMAASWYQKASDHGFSGASNNLAHLYLKGQGVPLSTNRAAQYWQLAASQGNALAMESLAYHYLYSDPDPRQAREWQKRAVEHGNLAAQLNAADFEAKANEIEEKQKPYLSEIAEWEKKTGNSSDGHTYKARTKRMLQDIHPEAVDVMERLNKIFEDSEVQGSTPITNKHNYFDPEMLTKYAELGSVTAARILTAMMHFLGVVKLFFEGNARNHSKQIIREIAECYRIEQLVVRLTEDWRELLYELVNDALKMTPENGFSDLDRDARIIYCYSMMDTMSHKLSFAQKSKLKYPNERIFHIAHAEICGFLRMNDLGVKVTENALGIFPSDFSLLYYRAVHIRLSSEGKGLFDHDKVIAAYEDFLSIAPKDDRKVPESLYAIANEYLLKSFLLTDHRKQKCAKAHECTKKAEEYYNLGIDAEKIQLPCFLLYESTQKELLDTFKLAQSKNLNQNALRSAKMSAMSATTNRLPIHKETPNSSELKPNYDLLTDINRLLVIKTHREFLVSRKEILNDIQTSAFPMQWTNKAAHVQRAPSQLIGLRPILFSDMDPCVDKVYESCVVQVTSVENPGIGGGLPSIAVVFQDNTGHLLRAFIYNFPDQDEKTIRDKLGFGAKMSIMNPYMRLAGDGKFGLRIDDPNCIHHHAAASETNKRCRFCGQVNSSFTCGQCKWANYCSKECQKMDWKLANHKSICGPL